MVFDGVFTETNGTVRFDEATHFSGDDASALTGAAARSRWAQLIARIYEVSPLRCPECRSDMRILAFLTDPEPVPELDLDETRGA